MSPWRLPRRIAAAALTAVLLAGGSPAASAAEAPTAWWYDAYDVGAIHSQGWTGKGVKVAVIDGNINPDLPAFAGRNLTVDAQSLCAEYPQPTTTEATTDSVHGTTLVAQIIGTGGGSGGIRGMAPDADLTFYSFGTKDGEPCAASEFGDSLSPTALGLQRAVDGGAQIVTISVAGGTRSGDSDVIANAVAKGVIVIVATNNPTTSDKFGKDMGGYRGVMNVSAVDRRGALQKSADGSPFALTWTTLVAPGVGLSTVGNSDGSWTDSETASGSSFSAPLTAAMLALVKQRYPESTSNQLLQSAIHNTGKDDHELTYDAASGFGYGLAWPAHMLRVSPLQYPDENPLLANGDPRPTDQQIEQAALRGSTYPPTENTDASGDPTSPRPSDTTPQDQPTSTSNFPLVVIVATLSVVLIAGGLITVVVVTRTRRNRAGGSK